MSSVMKPVEYLGIGRAGLEARRSTSRVRVGRRVRARGLGLEGLEARGAPPG